MLMSRLSTDGRTTECEDRARILKQNSQFNKYTFIPIPACFKRKDHVSQIVTHNTWVLFDSSNVFFFKIRSVEPKLLVILIKLNPKAIPTTGWKYSNSGWRDAPQLNVRGRE